MMGKAVDDEPGDAEPDCSLGETAWHVGLKELGIE
jgi:hypothetical protein